MTPNKKQVLAVVTARGGSKGLPRKNVLDLGGKPLIAWTISAAREATCIGRVIVSTDDEEIAEEARIAGAEVPFMRPSELASDTATSADVMAHAISIVPGFETAVLLQPTSPFRTASDLDSAFAAWSESDATACVSICNASESPWLMYHRTADGQIKSLLPKPAMGLRRQDLSDAYVLNGAFYFVQCDRFLSDRVFMGPRTLGYPMPRERSLDIDTQDDLYLARQRLADWHNKIPLE